MNKLAASSGGMLGQMMCEAAWWCLVYLQWQTREQDDRITTLLSVLGAPEERKHTEQVMMAAGHVREPFPTLSFLAHSK